MKEKVAAVSVGMDSQREYHFLSIALNKGLSNAEVKEISRKLAEYFRETGPFLLPEFAETEIQIRPSLGSENHFETFKMAIKEYAFVLDLLGFGEWADNFAVDGDLRPFDERFDVPPDVLAQQHRDEFNRQSVAIVKGKSC